jgi:arylsulfatase A-like enzyme
MGRGNSTHAPHPPPLLRLRRVVDDLGTALEVYGGLAITPNLKRLAAKGTQMRSAFVSIAVCAPSRTAQGC